MVSTTVSPVNSPQRVQASPEAISGAKDVIEGAEAKVAKTMAVAAHEKASSDVKEKENTDVHRALQDLKLEENKLVPIVEAIGKEVNNEENIVLEMKSKPYRLPLRSQENELVLPHWIPSMKGTLKLYRHKANGKTRLVQRNVIGTVKVNLAIKGGYVYDLQKNVRVVKKMGVSKEVASVSFYAIENLATGWERFMFKVSVKDVDNLYCQLKEMIAENKE